MLVLKQALQWSIFKIQLINKILTMISYIVYLQYLAILRILRIEQAYSLIEKYLFNKVSIWKYS